MATANAEVCFGILPSHSRLRGNDSRVGGSEFSNAVADAAQRVADAMRPVRNQELSDRGALGPV